MPTITLTITIDVPEGTAVETSSEHEQGDRLEAEGLPSDVADAVEQYVPTAYRRNVTTYLERCVSELGCSVEMPDSERRFEYVNVYPPPRCRRSRVSSVTYSSSRTAVFSGDTKLDGFEHAVKTFNNDTYVHPKLPHLDSEDAVNEAIELAKLAITLLER